MRVQSREIPYGHQGTKLSIAEMRKLVEAGTQEIKNIHLARNITRYCAPRDYECHVRAIYEWVKKTIAFRRDPVNVELVQDVQAILSQPFPSGDCDCHSVVVATLIECVGLPTRFVTTKDEDDSYTHVYTEVLIPEKGWTSADSSRKMFQLGGYIPHPYGIKIWNDIGELKMATPRTTLYPSFERIQNTLPTYPGGKPAVYPGYWKPPIVPVSTPQTQINVSGLKIKTNEVVSFRPGMLGADEAAKPSTGFDVGALISTAVTAGIGLLTAKYTSRATAPTPTVQPITVYQPQAVVSAPDTVFGISKPVVYVGGAVAAVFVLWKFFIKK